MRKRPGNNLCYLLVALLVLNAAFAGGQEPTIIAGKVADSKGIAIPGASIRISSGDKDLAETLSDLDGTFRFEGLSEISYQLTVDIAGFLKLSRNGVDPASESNRNLALQLEPLARPPKPKVAKQQPKQQQDQAPDAPSFQAAQVTDLPGLSQFRQDPSQSLSSDSSAVPAQENTLFITGNTLSIDAGNLNDPGFRGDIMNAARQMGFQMQEFGPGNQGGPGGMDASNAGGMGGAGGGMRGGPGGGGMGFVGMDGRGGRGGGFRQAPIEGTLSETFGNSALNASNYSLTGNTLNKPVQIQNNFSVTLGGVLPFIKSQAASSSSGTSRRGPVSRPGWSFSYSGSRNRSAQNILTTVPTDLERTGDFSQALTQTLTTDAVTGKPIVAIQPVQLYLNPNDPSTQFTRIASMDPIAAHLLQYIPAANIPCAANAPCVNNYFRGISLPSSSDQIQVSVSGLRITSKDTLSVTYSMRRGGSLSAATFPGLDTQNSNFGQNVGLSGNHSFRPRLILNWRLSLNRTRTEATNQFSYNNNVAGDLGITGVSQEPINWGPPVISFTNYGGISLAAPSLTRNQTISFSGGMNKVGKKHSIRMGGDFNWLQRNSQRDSNARGTYSFNGYATVLLDAQGRQVPGTGNDFADFLLGLPKSTSRSFVDPNINPYGSGTYLRNRNWSLYVMDDWRIRSNVTFNYGIRYEYSGPAFEKYNRLVSLDTSPDFSQLAQVFPEETGTLSGKYFPRSLVSPDRNNFAPRIGIAWRPTQRSPFVLRAGYGISYNTSGYSSIVSRLINQSPFAITQNLVSDPSNPLTIETGFPVNPAVTIVNTYAIDPNYKPSYAQQWNVDIQTQISRLYLLTVSYSGVKGTGLDWFRAPNRISNAGYFIYQTNGASSIYHGFALQFSRRFSQGFNLTNAYTFSKSIDDALGGSVAQNDANLAAERGLSDTDQRHNFQTNFTYELPIGENRAFFPGASAKLLNFIAGWTFNGNYSMTSGSPMTPRYASSNGNISSAALYNSLRPDVTGLPVDLPRDQRTVLRYFDTAAFSIPAGPYGTAGRNSITGPGSMQLNLSVRKSIRLDENNRRLDFSWQVQNLLNHPNWGGVSTTINSLNFGQVTSIRSMRNMTMNLRIRF
jgi:hypothetical protein